MKEAKEIIELVRTHFLNNKKVKALFLFGSVADNRFSSQSDLDIAIDMGSPMSVDERLDMIKSLSLLTGREIDLIDLHVQEGLLHYQIMTKGLKLICSSELYLYHMKKALYFHADFLPQLNQLSKTRIERNLNGS